VYIAGSLLALPQALLTTQRTRYWLTPLQAVTAMSV
jgi:hypothetical protein